MRILIIKDGCGEPYMVRFTLAEMFGRELKLHVMLRSDNDRELHDHPWGFWSLVLSGGYDEEIPGHRFLKREPGDLDYRPPEWRHKVILRACTLTEAMHYVPWPVKILRWLDRFAYFRRIRHWHEAQLVIRNQHINRLRLCCTLVLTTKRTRKWGFWRDGKFIPHDQFTSTADC